MQGTNRLLSHKAITHLEWLDTHVMPRIQEQNKEVEFHIEELRQILLKFMGAANDAEAYEPALDDINGAV